jgi:hypothetical protein
MKKKWTLIEEDEYYPTSSTTAYSLRTESVIAAPSSTGDSSSIAISSVLYLSGLNLKAVNESPKPLRH